jgi:hypothetical protein
MREKPTALSNVRGAHHFVIAVWKPKEHNRTSSMRLPFAFVAILACAISCSFSNAQESSISPDKRWECVGGDLPKILAADTKQVVFDLLEHGFHGDGFDGNDVLWAPDSQRFAVNYIPPHAHHTTYKRVAFYQLRGDKWIALHSPADASQPSQLLQSPLKDHLPKGFNPRHCAPEYDELKLRTWTDANTAILYAPCYDDSHLVKSAFLFTLKFDDAGWKIIKTHQMSKTELEEFE